MNKKLEEKVQEEEEEEEERIEDRKEQNVNEIAYECILLQLQIMGDKIFTRAKNNLDPIGYQSVKSSHKKRHG